MTVRGCLGNWFGEYRNRSALSALSALQTLMFTLVALWVPNAVTAEDVSVRLVASRTAMLAAEVSARVLKVAFREGEIFSAGDLLVSMDCTLYEARRGRTEAIRNRGLRQLETLQLLTGRGATSGLELATARFELDAAEADLRLANSEVGRCEITAPFSGAVVATRINAYEFVTVGQPLIEIIDLSTIEAQTFVPSPMLSWLEKGEPFQVFLAELPYPVSAEVERIAPAIDPVTQSVAVYGRIIADNPDLVLRSGMSGMARFEVPGNSP